MYLKFLDYIDLDDLTKENYKVFAHKDNENIKEKETLKIHIELCKKYFKRIYEDKELEKIFLNFENIFLKNPLEEEKELFRKMLLGIISLHDIGKINPNFQKEKMDNDLKIDMGLISDTNHSIYSSIIYIDYFLEEILNLGKAYKIGKDNKDVFFALLILNSYIISKHHSPLDDIKLYSGDFGKLMVEFEEYKIRGIKNVIEPVYFKKLRLNKGKINLIIDRFKEFNKIILEEENETKNSINLYTYERFMLSILIACDYYATSEYMSGTEINDIGTIKDIGKFYKSFREGEIYKHIREYEKSEYGKNQDFSKVDNINILRNEMFLDAEKEMVKNLNKNIFYLEAPTGSGKSNVANNLAFKIIEKDPSKNKIFYVYPFNTLIEQNIETLKKIYKTNKEVLEEIAVINSLFPIKEVINDNYERDSYFENEEYIDYSKSLLNRQFLNYPMILTTHVSLFSYMFGTNKENIFAFHQLANSVIILDEIQSYKNLIWREIIEFLNEFSKLLNIKIIIMSATLPNLEKLLNSKGLENDNSVNLIKNRDKYFKNKKFKNRVKVDYSLMDLEDEEIFEKLIEKLKEYEGKKRIVEFINKKSAYKFFQELKSKEELGEIKSEIRLLTGDDNSVERKNIIDEIKGNKLKYPLENIILVSTQVIEAGVDIDMDIGFKDSSILDSEEQFLGRINRSCLKEDSIVYFFNLDDAVSIYKEDVRKNSNLTLKNKELREILKEKQFNKYNELVNESLLEVTSRENSNNTREFFKNSVGNLNFSEIEKKMRLIDKKENEIQIFLAYELEVKDNKEESIKKINGEDVWQKYKKLLLNNDIDYAEKIIKLSKIKADMNYFIYRIKTNQNFNYNDRIGELIYISNGEDFFENGKLNKTLFEKDIGEFL
ncbi:CRISPR-associated helicase Cas3' [Clostridium sp.]|uniref:CRISPR-associated helicase Cas3' n=1 Tax=Clostridium sp. TaxID=1506 RepID=UPI00261927DF|nr:CRISPR-associated helicase Cas3' [Clostridium sp.]